jgi:hypothetical protein
MIGSAGIIVVVIIIIFLLGLLFLYIDFFCWMASGERNFDRLRRVTDKLLLLFSVLALCMDTWESNECCGGWSALAPAHRLSVYLLVLCCWTAYFYSTIRKRIAPPLPEIAVNCLLLIGVLLSILFGVHGGRWEGWVFFSIPLCMLFIMAIARNHRLALGTIEGPIEGEDRLMGVCRYLLYLPVWQKLPVLIVMCLPVLVSLVAILLLFGQRPDSLVRAFTDTYKHGLSELDIDCSKVVCGGHFLCTVGASGHPRLVRPFRTGVRAGKRIRCNRQLLVSNAFEELLEDRVPWLHRPLRQLYNHVGKFVHRYYGVFDKVWVADMVYLLMKPLEMVFILTLYLFDRNPENRIGQQYIRQEDRAMISER